MNFGGHHPAPGHGKISPRCVPEGASDGKNTGSRQHIACMYSNAASFGKICAPCIQKAPQSAVGEYAARTSCRQGALSPSEAPKSCTAHESCHPPPDGLAPAQGLLPGQPHRGIAFQRLGPCPGVPAPPRSRKGVCCLAFPGIAKAHAARHFPERRRNACRAPFQQMFDAMRCRLSTPYWL